MKKILYLFVATLLLFTSCDKEQDPKFSDSPETRINNVLTQYKTILTKNDGTWIAYYSGSAILMKFNEDNTVEFKSTYRDGSDDRTITYRVGITQVPELIFESHSVFQAIYEDNLATGEYEFLFDKVTDSRIDFISKTDRGANKTTLTFFKGTEEDLLKAQELTNQLNILSVFKEVVIAGGTKHKIAISLESGGKAQLDILVDGKTTSENYSYDVTSNGIIFQPALNLNSTLTAGEFTYDDESKTFTSTDAPSVSIKIVNEPVLPLTSYDFGKKDALNNLFEVDRSSFAYNNFYNSFNAQLTENYGGSVQRYYLKSLSSTTESPYLYIYTSWGKIWYDFTYEIKADKKVYFTLSGPTNAPDDLNTILKPLLEKIFNTNGHFIEGTGSMRQYTNGTFALINADDPSIKINFIDL